MRQHQIHVVAAKHQMFANADPGQLRLTVLHFHLDQGEIGGAAADIAHQDQPRLFQLCRKRIPMPEQPVVESSLRLLQQPQLRQSGLMCRLNGERACAFVKRCGDGQYHILLLQRTLRKAPVPCRTHMREIAGARVHRRHLQHISACPPGQYRRKPVDRRVRQPALCARDQPAGNLRTEFARQCADDHRLWFRRLGRCPRKLQITRRQLTRRRMKTQRRQERCGFNLAGCNQLFDVEQSNLVTAELGISDHGIGGAKIDADCKSLHRITALVDRARRTPLSSVLHRCAALPTIPACRLR